MDEEKNGDIFTAVNVLGDFFVKVYQEINHGVIHKIERIIN